MASCMDLANKFHSLEGTSIGEKKKSLYHLLRATSAAPDIENLSVALQELKPSTYFETILWIETLIHFRRTKELLEVLKSGNEILISKIIQQKWFFEEAFKTVTGDEIVNEICPYLSYRIRMKVLKRISQSLSEEQMDDVYNSLLKKYGLFIATNILCSCSAKKIEEVLKSDNITLGCSQLIHIFDKDPKLLETYIVEYKKNDNTVLNNTKLFQYIAKKDVLYYWYLKENYEINFRLGKRSTKKFLDEKRTVVIENPEKFQGNLQWRSLTRKLQSDYKKVFTKLFSKDINYPDSWQTKKLLKHYPNKYKYSLLAETFRSIHKDEIWNHSLWMNDEFLPIIPNEDKVKWAEIQFKTSGDNIKFLKYLPVTKSIPLLKERITLTSDVSQRGSFLTKLIDCCCTQNDNVALEEILKYICFRHRNEDPSVRGDILYTISNTNLANLNEQHWSYINEMITVQRMKNYFIGSEKLRKAYIEFLFNNGKPYQKELRQFFKDNQYNTFILSVKNFELERAVLCFAIDEIPQFTKDEEIINKHTNLIWEISTFNEEHPDLHIDIFSYPELIKFVKTILRNRNKNEMKGIYKIISHLPFSSNRTNAEYEILVLVKEYYLTNSKQYLKNILEDLLLKMPRTDSEHALFEVLWNQRIGAGRSLKDKYTWLIKYQPQVILDHFDGFCQIISNLKRKNLYMIKKYSHLKFDEMCINFLKTYLLEDYCKSRNWIVRPLSILMDPEEYLKCIERFIPTSKKMTLRNQDELYNLQCYIGRDLKYIRSPIVIPILLKWCAGDYLRTTLPALWATFYRMPENTLFPIADHLYDQAVSVRKHALFLACNVFNQDKIFEILSHSGTIEKNISIRKHLFSTTLKYFIRNPSDECFDLIKRFVETVERSDWESLHNLTYINNIPRNYKITYIQIVMNLYDEIETVSVETHKKDVLSSLSESDISQLPINFSKVLIEKYFLEINCSFKTDISNFVILFLKTHDNQQNFQFISKLVSNCWNTNNEDMRDLVYCFFYNFFNRAKQMTDLNTDFIRYFTEMFKNIFNPVDSFNEYVLNRLIDTRRQITEPFFENLALEIIQLGEELEKNFGLLILITYIELVHKSIESYIKNKFTFCKYILDTKVSVSTCFIVLQLLKTWSKPSNEDEWESYNAVIEIIRNVIDPNVQLHFNMYLRQIRE